MTTATLVLALVGAVLLGVGLGIALCTPAIERERDQSDRWRRRAIIAEDQALAERTCRRRAEA